MSTVLLTGAGGMIGTALISYLKNSGHHVRTLVRNQKKADGKNSYYWNYTTSEVDLKAFEGVDYIINLSGATISKRWSLAYKKEIYDSRIMTLDFLYQTIKTNNLKIKKLISVSGTGYYGDTTENNLQETHKSGNDFLSMVCRDWEQAANQFSNLKIPVCILRVGVVMNNSGGFVKRIGLTVKLFLGAHLGSGKQILSWISLHDICRLFGHIIEKNLVGVYNATSSNPMTLEAIDDTIARYYHRKIWLPNVPEWALKLALGEMSAIVLANNHCSNSKIKTTGFIFEHEDLMQAI